MAVLHLVNRATALASCLEAASLDDVVLLIENGVYAAAQPPLADRPLLAMGLDVQARGLGDRLTDNVEVVSYADFVSLAEAHNPVVTWH